MIERGSGPHPLRIACIAVPLFALAARLRSEPELLREALVIVEGNGNAARVVAATRLARNAGVRPGLTLPQARALIPKLVARPRDDQCERAAQEALIETAESFSPRVEDAGEGTAFVDLDGSGRLPEIDLGRALLAAAAAAGLPARAGIASSKLAAQVAAGLPESPVVVPAGEEAAFLAPLPLARLAPQVEIAATLERWGIRSIGDFARLPRARVASRLGNAGNELHATARGLDPRPLMPREPPPVFHEGMSLEWPLVSLEPFLFVGRAALERLCRRLEARGLACARLELALRLEPEGHQLRTIDLPAPTRDTKTLLTLVRLDLEGSPPGAPVAGFTLAARPDRPREEQLSLYGPATLSPDKLASTLARLFALLGPGRIGSPRIVDGHLPERFALVEYAPPPPPMVRREPRRRDAAGHGLLAVRTLRPPVAIEVIVAEPPAQPPPSPLLRQEAAALPQLDPAPDLALLPPCEIRALVADGAGEAAGRPRIAGRVKVASGPWGLEDGWWAPQPAGRDYWDVELTGGGLYRLFRDRGTGAWYADGIYD
ncbi:MAG TPA: DNA polymerase Y family protein [Thermoanaerobaculia bacterium]|nr:DNA polymerase Y family protein [Thermoanaerobaculia bacterium]